MEKQKCPVCKFFFDIDIKSTPTKKYCSKKCKRVRQNTYNRLRWKNNEQFRLRNKLKRLKNPDKYKKIQKKGMKKFLKNNRKRFNQLMKEAYYRNRDKNLERRFVNNHREKIIKIIGKKCRNCDAKMERICFLKYKNLPRDNLKKYCKYLISLCRVCSYKVRNDKKR